jgi:hypothetical protein
MSASECYGRMFPPTLVRTANMDVRGKVFGYRLDHTGVVESARSVTTDRSAWQACTICPDFDACSRLSTGTVLMEIAVRG